MRDGQIKIPVHTDGHDLSAVQRNFLHLFIQGEVFIRICSGVVGTIGDIFPDILIIQTGDLIPCIKVIHSQSNTVFVRREKQICMSVIKGHGIIISGKDLQISDDLRAVRVIRYDNGHIIFLGIRIRTDHGGSGFHGTEISVRIHPGNRRIFGFSRLTLSDKPGADLTLCHGDLLFLLCISCERIPGQRLKRKDHRKDQSKNAFCQPV